MSMLSELWSFGWKRLANFRPDDVILFTHVSSLISKEVLLFLKLYDGYPEPFYFKLRPLMFTFWKQIKSDVSLKLVPFKPLGCTFQFIVSLCDYKVMKLFTNKCIHDVHQKALFEKNHWAVQDWIIGDEYSFSGWQCNLCCRDDCVQTKIKTDEWVLKNITASLTFSHKLPNMSVIETILGSKNSSYIKDFNIIPKSDPFYAP
ncbi:Beta-1,4-mannosyl-glycoprotein 4-beta-N-acetylglucosaminyltransferase, partial [Stegodyphus mimosarum]